MDQQSSQQSFDFDLFNSLAAQADMLKDQLTERHFIEIPQTMVPTTTNSTTSTTSTTTTSSTSSYSTSLLSTTSIPIQPASSTSTTTVTTKASSSIPHVSHTGPSPTESWEVSWNTLDQSARLRWFDEFLDDLKMKAPDEIKNYLLFSRPRPVVEGLLEVLHAQSIDEKLLGTVDFPAAIQKINQIIVDTRGIKTDTKTPDKFRSTRRAILSEREKKGSMEIPERFKAPEVDKSVIDEMSVNLFSDSDALFSQAMYYNLGENRLISWGDLLQTLKGKTRKEQMAERSSWVKYESMFKKIEFSELNIPYEVEPTMKITTHNAEQIGNMLTEHSIGILDQRHYITMPRTSFRNPSIPTMKVRMPDKDGNPVSYEATGIEIKNHSWVLESTVRGYPYSLAVYPPDWEARNTLVRLLRVFHVRSRDMALSDNIRARAALKLVDLKKLWLIRNYVLENFYYGKANIEYAINRLRSVLDIHEMMLQSNPVYAQDPEILSKIESIEKSKGKVPPGLKAKLNGLVTGVKPAYLGFIDWKTNLDLVYPTNTRFPWFMIDGNLMLMEDSLKKSNTRYTTREWVPIQQSLIKVNKESEAGPLYNGMTSERRINSEGKPYGHVTRGDTVSLLTDLSMPIYVFDRIRNRAFGNINEDLSCMSLYNEKGKAEPYALTKEAIRGIGVYSGCFGNINAYIFGCTYRDSPCFLFHPTSMNLMGYSYAHGGVERLILILTHMDFFFGVTSMIVFYCDNFYYCFIDPTLHIGSFDIKKMEGSQNIYTATYEVYRAYENSFAGKAFISEKELNTLISAIDQLDPAVGVKMKSTSWGDRKGSDEEDEDESTQPVLTTEMIMRGMFESPEKERIIKLVEDTTIKRKSRISEPWAYYMAVHMPETICDVVLQFTGYQIPLPCLISGSQGTAFLNGALMGYTVKKINEYKSPDFNTNVQDMLLDREKKLTIYTESDVLRGGNRTTKDEHINDVDEPELNELLESGGLFATLEAVCTIDYNKKIYIVDWLGNDWIHFHFFELEVMLPALSKDRLAKNTFMKKHSEKFSTMSLAKKYGTTLINYITANSKYLVGAWAYDDYSLLYQGMATTASNDLTLKEKMNIPAGMIEDFVTEALGEVNITDKHVIEMINADMLKGLVFDMSDVIRIFGRRERVSLIVDEDEFDFLDTHALQKYFNKMRVPQRFKMPLPGKNGWFMYKPGESKHDLNWSINGPPQEYKKIKVYAKEGEYLKKNVKFFSAEVDGSPVEFNTPAEGRISHIGHTPGNLCCFEPLPMNGKATIDRDFKFSDQAVIINLAKMYYYEVFGKRTQDYKFVFYKSDYDLFGDLLKEHAPEDYQRMYVKKTRQVTEVPEDEVELPFKLAEDFGEVPKVPASIVIRPPEFKERPKGKAKIVRDVKLDLDQFNLVAGKLKKLPKEVHIDWPKSLTTKWFVKSRLIYDKPNTAEVRNLLRRALIYHLGGNSLIYDELALRMRKDRRQAFYPDVSLIIHVPNDSVPIITRPESLTKELEKFSQPRQRKATQKESKTKFVNRAVKKSKMLWARRKQRDRA